MTHADKTTYRHTCGFPHVVPPTKPPPLYQGAAVRIILSEYISPTPSTGAPTPRLSWGLQDWPQTSLRHSRASCSIQAAAGSKAPTQDHRAQLIALRGHLHYQMEGQRHLRPPRCHSPRNVEYCWIAAPPPLPLKSEPALLALISLVPFAAGHPPRGHTKYFILINAAGLVRPVLFPWTVLLCSFVYMCNF